MFMDRYVGSRRFSAGLLVMTGVFVGWSLHGGETWAAEPIASGRPLTGKPYIDMDYGPYLTASLQVEKGNIAYKGIAIRLDEGSGGVSQGNEFVLFDTDTLRYAAGWTGS